MWDCGNGKTLGLRKWKIAAMKVGHDGVDDTTKAAAVFV